MRVLLVDVQEPVAAPLRMALSQRHEVVSLGGDPRDLEICRQAAGCDVVVHALAPGADALARIDAAGRGTWNLLTTTRVGRLRTIGCREATSRVARLRPAQVGGDTLELLIGIRDGIVHVGYAEESDARDLLAASLRYARELLKDLVGRDPLWGSHAEFVESLISESLTRTQQVVTRKIATAKLFVADLASRVPPEELAMVLSVRQSSSATAVYGDNDEFEVSCPVCEDDNARSIGPSTIQWLPDFDIGDEGEEYIAGLYGVKEMYPNRFECGACGLTLDSADEIRAAGLETTIELEDGLNPADFPEEFEPDPDLREDK